MEPQIVSYEMIQNWVTGIVYASFIPLFFLKIKSRNTRKLKRILKKRLCAQQTLKEITLGEFEQLPGSNKIDSNILAFIFGQRVQINHLGRLCIAELKKSGCIISEKKFSKDKTTYSCTIEYKFQKYRMTVLKGAFISKSYIIWFDELA
jgi:hypothetical protein